MTLPAFVGASNASYIAAGTHVTLTKSGCQAGNLIICHTMIDLNSGFSDYTNITNAQDLTGTSASMSTFSTIPIGLTPTGKQETRMGRAIAAGTVSMDVGHDLGTASMFAQFFEFSGVIAGPKVAENNRAFNETSNPGGNWTYGQDTTTSIIAPNIVTGGEDRLAVNFMAVNGNQALAEYSGETGGDYVKPIAEFSSGLGTAGSIGFQMALMLTAGTLSGGSITITSHEWANIGFALLPANYVSTNIGTLGRGAGW